MVNEIDGCLFCVSLLNDEILGLEQTVPWFSSLFTLLRVESDGERVEKYVALWLGTQSTKSARRSGRYLSGRFFLSARLSTVSTCIYVE